MKKITSLFLCLLCVNFSFSQEENFIPSQHLPTQNFLKYQQFLLNPALSQVGEKRQYISLFNRRQWSGFEGAPTIYSLSYAAKPDEKKGVGASLFQQNNGVLTYFGANVNFAYGIQFSEKIWLTLGANMAYFENGISNDAYTNQPDPALLTLQENSAISFQPGINLRIGKFHIGAYAENLVVYNFTAESALEEEKRFSGHLMYASSFSENNYYKILARARKSAHDETDFGGNILFGLNNFGWAQIGYDSFYGGSAGIGIEVTQNFTVGYIVEKDISGELSNFGVTHEFLLAYNFSTSREKQAAIKPTKPVETYSEADLENLQKQIETNRAKSETMEKRLDSILQNKKRLSQISAVEKTEESSHTENERENMRINSYNKADFPDAAPGFYIVANVYSHEGYRDLFLRNMKKEGFEAGYIKNKNTQYDYVYLAKYDSRNEAVAAFKSKMNNRYEKKIWILEIK